MQSESNLDSLLDEELAFILNYTSSSFNQFAENSEENKIANLWLVKLCCEVVQSSSILAKQTRNMYLIRLIECFQVGSLLEPFKQYPTPGPLKPFRINSNGIEPSWYKELVEEANIHTQNEIEIEIPAIVINPPQETEVLDDVHKYIIDTIEAELNGNTEPGQCVLLENILAVYKETIIGSKIHEHVSKLPADQVRYFLMFQLQSQFINDWTE